MATVSGSSAALDSALRRLVDADVAPAGGGERFTVPASRSLAQPETGDPRHQVELGWVSQAETDRAERNSVLTDVDVVRVQELRNRVITADVERHVVGCYVLGLDELVIRSRRSGRHAAFENEH